MFKKLTAACVAATAMIAFATPASASVDDFIGSWSNADRGASGVTRVTVANTRGGLRVNVSGQCHPRDCDWGEVAATPYAPTSAGDAYRDANTIIARYDAGFARRIVILRLRREGVEYEVFTDFTDSSRRPSYVESGRLIRWERPGPGGPRPGPFPPGTGSISEDCVGFTPGNLRVANVSGSWKIVDGSHWISDFGSNRAAADRAYQVIMRYGFTSQCFVTRPNASMTYWRRGTGIPTGGAAGGMPGEDCIAMNPANVQARFVGGAWKVVEGSHWILDFGSNRAGADQAVQTIQHYNMTHQCFVSRPNAQMTYWLSR